MNGKAQQEPVTDSIFLIKGENNGRFPYSHSILIVDAKIVIIDTGCGIETLKKLRKEHNPTCIVNSHTHPDHSAGNWVFKDVSIYVPKEGFDTSGNIITLSERFVSKDLAGIWREFVRKDLGFKECRPTHSYGNQKAFTFGRTTLEPIYTPGHTKDHYCLFEPKERILFSFDYDLTAFPWYGHRESSIPDFRESIEKLKNLSPKVVVTSHRAIIRQNIHEEFDKFSRIIDRRDERILSLLKDDTTIDQLVNAAPIYGKFSYAEPLLRYWEEQMIRKHLERLEIDGGVKRTGEYYKSMKKRKVKNQS